MREPALESDERVVHRIEAFADIVIGFSLAQLGVNLVVPPRAADIYRHPIGLLAFAMTFSIVCRMWWSHHRLFTHYFVPRPLPIGLCFATLGVLVFALYALQIFIHFGVSDPVALLTYMGAFGLLFLLLGCEYIVGLALRGATISREIHFRGLRLGLLQLAFGLAFLFGVAAVGFFGSTSRALETFAFVFFIFAITVRLMLRRLQQRAPQVG